MKKLLFVLMACVLSLGLIGGAFAYFSDTETSTANSFTAGTLTLNHTGITSASPITITCMAPGDVTGEYVITIENTGCIDLAWLGDWQFTSPGGTYDLMDALYIDYGKMEFLSPTNADWCSDGTAGYEADGSDIFIMNGVGHGPYPTWYNTLAGMSTLGVVTFTNWDNNNGMGSTPYENIGALKHGYKYRLTVKFGFAPLAGNEYQGLGPVTAQLVVNATQINSAALQAQGVSAASAPGLVTWMNAQIADQTES
jgi:predicted ribosomally synthesized peptide with SipW-like signal peptide